MKLSSLKESLLNSRWSGDREKKLLDQTNVGLIFIKNGKNDLEQKIINFLAAFKQGDAASQTKLLSESRDIAMSVYSRFDCLCRGRQHYFTHFLCFEINLRRHQPISHGTVSPQDCFEVKK